MLAGQGEVTRMLEIIDETGSPARLKVIGVGGGGSNAVNRMIEAGLRDVEFWVANTDKQALDRSPCLHRLQIGRATTRGLGAGGDPEIGRLSAEEDQAAIEKIVSGADMVFITAGMGGGTGTGAAPVLARYAREMGVLTVAIVTKPFAFEGRKKMARASHGLEALSDHVDTLIAIPNQKLMHIVEPGTSFSDALLMADEVLFQATRGISDLIMGHGIINLDFADVRTVMRDRGNALLGSGTASGKDRAVEAAQAAVSSPLLEEVSIEGAEALLVNIQGGASMSFHEAAEAAQFIADRVGEDADVFWGAVVDPSLDEEIRVTLIATGFPGARRLSDASVPLVTPHAREPRPGELRGIASRRNAARYESIEVNLASGPAREESPAVDGTAVERRDSDRAASRREAAASAVDGRLGEKPPLRAAVRAERSGQEDGWTEEPARRRSEPESLPRQPEPMRPAARPAAHPPSRAEKSARPEPVYADASLAGAEGDARSLRGVDDGITARGYDGSIQKNGNRREERGSHRNPLDVPTYLRKPVDD
jgi:cell division protein FtsZ